VLYIVLVLARPNLVVSVEYILSLVLADAL